MSDTPHTQQHDAYACDLGSIDDIRREAEALTAAEENAARPKDAARAEGKGDTPHAGGNGGSQPPEGKRDPITHDFVLACSKARDKGNGVLYAALMRNKFSFVPEQN